MYHFHEEQKRQMQREIAQYFKDEFELELGIIGTNKIFDFFQELLGDQIYNIALDDAKKFYQMYADHMDSDYYALYKEVR